MENFIIFFRNDSRYWNYIETFRFFLKRFVFRFFFFLLSFPKKKTWERLISKILYKKNCVAIC